MRGFSILFRSQLFIRLTSLIVLSAFVQFGLMQIQMFYLNVSALYHSERSVLPFT